jgi:pyridoxine 5-phosphate synthase
MVEGAKTAGADRVELYTEPYAANYPRDKAMAIAPYLEAAKAADDLSIGLNAGHDLSLDNLAYFVKHIPTLLEVSIGHALIADALYFGLENTVNLYLQQIRIGAGLVKLYERPNIN